MGGDTLVVDVIGFNDKTWIAGAGTFHSEGAGCCRSEVALFGDVTCATTFDPEKFFVRKRQKLLDNGVTAINILRRCARRKETSQLGWSGRAKQIRS